MADGKPSDLTVSLKEYFETILSLRNQIILERDRRYTEVNIEREKALKIKETADLAALQLARDIQIYKDEKANELREQINNERHLYATNKDLDPIKAYIAGRTGSGVGMSSLAGWAMSALMAGIAITAVYLKH